MYTANSSKTSTIIIAVLATALIVSFFVGFLVSFAVFNWQSQKIAELKKENRVAQAKLKKQIKLLRKGTVKKNAEDKTPDVSSDKSSVKDDLEKWPYYKNERFSYVVQIPPSWSKTHSQNGDGITLAKGGQKILVYGTNDVYEHKTLLNHLSIEYGDKAAGSNKIIFKTKAKAINTVGFYVKTKSEEFYIYKSWDYFVYVYTESAAQNSTKKTQKKIAKSFQVLGQ